MSVAAFDVDNTLGALLVGTLVSYALFGVATTQAYVYYGRFPDDSAKMKALVGFVWCAEFAHAICIATSIYEMVITNYGHPNLMTRLPNSLVTSTLIGSCVAYVIQTFFAYRIYALSKSLWIPCICWTLSLFRVVSPNVVMFAYGIHQTIPVFLTQWGWLFDAVWAISALNDMLIAGTLVFMLYRRRSEGLTHTVAVVDKMIKWTIETGVVTSIASIAMIGVFLSMRLNFVWMAIFVVIPRLFSNSFFASLNSRTALRFENDHEFTVAQNIPAARSARVTTTLQFGIGTTESRDTGTHPLTLDTDISEQMSKITTSSYEESPSNDERPMAL
ncbi:hypothetical protein K438DRAFT_715635 [Mycena galopus ATCC 62051]|nr:hypothetical protein K438DRAFT_715635 [Mycena galopus ATCC 62051]